MKISKKIVCIVLVCLMLIGILTALPLGVSAKTTDLAEVGGYDTSYTVTGNGAADMVGIANKQLWKSGYELGYSSRNWCSFFVCQCAKLVGQSTAIPYYSYVRELYPNVIAAGGKIVSAPQAGDLVFYYCEWSNPKHYCHVGLMIDSVNSIQGNMTHIQEDVDRVRPIVAESGYYHCSDSNGIPVNYCTKKIYVRPNYQGGGTPVNPSNPLPGTSTLTVHPGTSAGYTSFVWTSATDTDYYELWVKNPADNSTVKYMGGLYNTQYQLQLPMGNYYAYIASIDHDRYAANSSPWWTYSNTVEFTVTDQAFVPTASVIYGDSYYELYNITMPWSKAKTQCEAMGGHLATISSAEENNIIETLSYYGDRYAYWIGMTDEVTEGTWKTVTGEPINYVNWADGQPNNQNNEDYSVIRAKEKAVWNDVPDRYANYPVGFICEYDYDPTYIRCSASEMYNDNRYETYNLLMTWDDAKEYCESIGGHLVTISDKAETDFVNSLVDKGGVSAYWMGISDEGNEGTWTNVTGEPMYYTNWEAGEPNNSGGIENNCVICYNEGHTWNDLANNHLISFICEFEADYKDPFTTPSTAPITEPITQPDSNPNTKPTVEPGIPDSKPVEVKPTSTVSDSEPTDVNVTPAEKMEIEAEVANQETGDILFTYSGVKKAYYYDLTFYDFSGEKIYTKSSETTEYIWAPEDNVYGYVKVVANDNKGKTLKETALYSYILIDNEIQLVGNYGDADENFKINIKDATAIQKHLANILKLSDFAVRLADSNGDGKVNIKDATTVQKHCANLKPESKIGEMLTDSYIQKEIFLTKEADSTDPTEATDGTTGDFIESPVTTEATEPAETVKPTIAIPTETTEVQTPTVQIITTEATEATEATDSTTGDDLTTDFLIINTSDGYTAAKVGDTITYFLELEAAERFEDIQGSILYDSAKLKLKDQPATYYCPILSKQIEDMWDLATNSTLESEFLFNAVEVIDGFDFTEKRTLVMLEFEVTAEGTTEIDYVIKEMSLLNGDGSYFSDGNQLITDGITLTTSFE